MVGVGNDLHEVVLLALHVHAHLIVLEDLGAGGALVVPAAAKEDLVHRDACSRGDRGHLSSAVGACRVYCLHRPCSQDACRQGRKWIEAGQQDAKPDSRPRPPASDRRQSCSPPCEQQHAALHRLCSPSRPASAASSTSEQEVWEHDGCKQCAATAAQHTSQEHLKSCGLRGADLCSDARPWELQPLVTLRQHSLTDPPLTGVTAAQEVLDSHTAGSTAPQTEQQVEMKRCRSSQLDTMSCCRR